MSQNLAHWIYYRSEQQQQKNHMYRAIVMAISLEVKVMDVNTKKDIHGRKILHDFITAEFMF